MVPDFQEPCGENLTELGSLRTPYFALVGMITRGMETTDGASMDYYSVGPTVAGADSVAGNIHHIAMSEPTRASAGLKSAWGALASVAVPMGGPAFLACDQLERAIPCLRACPERREAGN